MIENTLFYELIVGAVTMNNEDLALYQQAQELANSGQLSAAHQIFCNLRQRNADIEILFGIATTTANPVETRQMIDMIRSLQPYHPQLSQLEALHNQKMQMGYTAGAISSVLLCPYCGNRAPALLRNKTATAGWVIFVVLLIIFFPLCWIGFFFQEPYYVCAYCGSKISGTR
jgi:hypothetical protein